MTADSNFEFDRIRQPNTSGQRFRIMTQVVGALIIRDMKTRFGRSAAGFFLAQGLPFAHLALLVIIYKILGRSAPLGNDPITFFSLGVLCYVVFAYPYLQIVRSTLDNKPLLYFPRVKLIDILIARCALEILGACVVCVNVIVAMLLFGVEFSPHDFPLVLVAFASALYFGISFGVLIASVCVLWPPLAYAGSLLRALFWGGSAAFYLPDMLPNLVREIVYYNPLAHSIELARVAYYDDFSSNLLDPTFLFWAPTFILALGLVVMDATRRFVH